MSRASLCTNTQTYTARERMASGLSKILVFGGTGYLGKYIVKASIMMGHPTYVYGRPITPNTIPTKIQLHNDFQSMGVSVIQGELIENEKLVSIIKQVDVVISALPVPQILDQLKIIDAIKIAGNIKRFIPSDFGCDEDRISGLPPFEACLEKKKQIRRATEAAGIPFTFVSSTLFAEYFLNVLLHPHDQFQELQIYGTGEAKVVFTCEKDIGMYTIKVANDPRTCNRTVLCRPSRNVVSQLDLVFLWEKKIGRTYKRVFVPEEEIVKQSETAAHPENVRAAILHSLFVRGNTTNFEVLREVEVEVSDLYPEFEYTTIDQLLDAFVVNPPKVDEYAAL